MSKKIEKTVREVNGISVEQRIDNGFINATAMCVANDKEIKYWFQNKETITLFYALNEDIGSIKSNVGITPDLDISKLSATKYGKYFPDLILVKRGSPENGGGVWLHPDLAIQLAQWCNAAFALQVSKWVREWMTTGQNPVWSQDDLDRVGFRANLKDEARLRLTGQVKIHLERIRKYDDHKFAGKFFAAVHDEINLAITGEKAWQMRKRLSTILGKEIKQSELIRDYYPSLYLQRYISVCEAAANYMLNDSLHPLTAVEKASTYCLPANYQPKAIDFVEHIKLVRGRVVSSQINLPYTK